MRGERSRAHRATRVSSQPWLHEAVGTARWRGTPLRALLAEAGVADQAVELVFTGLDQGLEGGIEQAYQRSLSPWTPTDEVRSPTR